MNEQLARAKKDIEAIFGDTSVSRAETREALEELASQIETYLESLQDD